jgi:hypothetical protein
MYVIRLVKLMGFDLSGRGRQADGKLLQFYDPDGRNGEGVAIGAERPADALRFETKQEAIKFYRQVSKVKPLRDDGKPNRPLTAYAISIEEEVGL